MWRPDLDPINLCLEMRKAGKLRRLRGVLASACCACAAAYRHDTDHTGQQFSVIRERIRQIEAKAPRKLKLKLA
jgi:hypothetical protein